MGQDENKNPFSGNVTPNPRATFTSGNRLGMRPSRDLSAMDELNRISADSNPNQPQPTGDIVLNNDGAKKSGNGKRILIISLIILVFAAIVGAAAFFMVNQNRSTNRTINTNDVSYKALEAIKSDIEKYAKFLQNGSTNGDYNKDLKIEDWDFVDRVSSDNYSAEDKYQYSSNVLSQYNDIKKSVDNLSDSTTKTKISTAFKNQSNSMTITSEYLKNDYIVDEINKSYLSGGMTAATSTMNSFNSSMEKPDTSSDEYKWYEKIISIRALSLTTIDALNRTGCIVNGIINDVCVNNLYNNPDLYKEYLDSEKELNLETTNWKIAVKTIATAVCSSMKNLNESIGGNNE